MTARERGLGTVISAGIAFVLLSVTALSVLAIGWFGSIRRGEQIAEVAALAAASAAVEGHDPCAAAAAAAQRNGLELAVCQVQGSAPNVVVEAAVEIRLSPPMPGIPPRVLRHATAGTI